MDIGRRNSLKAGQAGRWAVQQLTAPGGCQLHKLEHYVRMMRCYCDTATGAAAKAEIYRLLREQDKVAKINGRWL